VPEANVSVVEHQPESWDAVAEIQVAGARGMTFLDRMASSALSPVEAAHADDIPSD